MEEGACNAFKKLPIIILLLFVLFLIVFCTWQLFQGNFEAAFLTLPFLLIVYLFVIRRRP